MRGEDFCPLCGRADGRFIKGLCEECFLKKHRLVEIPDAVEFEECRDCAKVRVSGKFVPFNEDSLKAIVEKKIKVKGLEQETVAVKISKDEEGFVFANVAVKGIAGNAPLFFEKEVRLEAKVVQCDSCMRLASQYHEAIIQLRGKGKKELKKMLDALVGFVKSQRARDGLAVVTEVSEEKTGYDLKVGSKKAAQNAARQMRLSFGAETKVSSKLLGRDKNGREKHRFTFLVRL